MMTYCFRCFPPSPCTCLLSRGCVQVETASWHGPSSLRAKFSAKRLHRRVRWQVRERARLVWKMSLMFVSVLESFASLAIQLAATACAARIKKQPLKRLKLQIDCQTL